MKVPDGFLGSAMPVPHPKGGALYVKLRDDPSVINTTSVVAQEIPPSADEAARTEVRSSAVPAAAHPEHGAGKYPEAPRFARQESASPVRAWRCAAPRGRPLEPHLGGRVDGVNGRGRRAADDIA